MEPAALYSIPSIIESEGKQRQYNNVKYTKNSHVGSGATKTVWKVFYRTPYGFEAMAAVKIKFSDNFDLKCAEEELKIRHILSENPAFNKVLHAFYIPSKKKMILIEPYIPYELYNSIQQVFENDLSMDVIKKVKEAVKFAHSRKIVLADLKPENILISRLEKPFHLIVTDLGGSYIEGQKPRVLNYTRSYTAPEKYLKPQSFPPRSSDIYSLGKTCFFVLKAGRYFDVNGDEPHQEYLNKIKMIRGSVPPGPYQKEIQSMLDIDPKKRPVL